MVANIVHIIANITFYLRREIQHLRNSKRWNKIPRDPPFPTTPKGVGSPFLGRWMSRPLPQEPCIHQKAESIFTSRKNALAESLQNRGTTRRIQVTDTCQCHPAFCRLPLIRGLGLTFDEGPTPLTSGPPPSSSPFTALGLRRLFVMLGLALALAP